MTHAFQSVRIGAISQRFSNEVGDLQHFLFLHAARSDRRRADADAARLENGICVERDRIFVHRDPGAIKNLLRFLTVDFLGAKIDQHQVVIRSARNNSVTVLGEASGQRLCIQDDLPLIFAELRLKRFVKTNCLRCNHVHEWTALHAREESRID